MLINAARRWQRWGSAPTSPLISVSLRLALIGLLGLVLGGLGLPMAALAEPVSAAAPADAPPPPSTDCRGVKDTRKTSGAKRTPFTVCGIAVVSPKHRVSAAYRPVLITVSGIRRFGLTRARLAPEAARALRAMADPARRSGHILGIRAAYRSYSAQRTIHSAGGRLTAPPGASEHQLGLAVDLAAYRNGRVIQGYEFGNSAAGRWLDRNAASFGFILRYPSGRQRITGIPYEPWHYRWVGVEHATRIAAVSGQTLERYLKLS